MRGRPSIRWRWRELVFTLALFIALLSGGALAAETDGPRFPEPKKIVAPAPASAPANKIPKAESKSEPKASEAPSTARPAAPASPGAAPSGPNAADKNKAGATEPSKSGGAAESKTDAKTSTGTAEPSIGATTLNPVPKESAARPANQAAVEAPLYRPIALQAQDVETSQKPTPNAWTSSATQLPDGTVIEDYPTVPPGDSATTFESYSDEDAYGPFWTSAMKYTVIPLERLWIVPLANQREPRMYAKFTNLNNQSTIDTAIGGQFGIARLGPADNRYEGVQLDGFGAAFTRFDGHRNLITTDFRAGVPLTYAKGPWQAKVGYEHTSCHLGDDFIQMTGQKKIAHVRDEAVIGLARYFWDQVRLYGQAGFAVHTSPLIGNQRDRWDWGLEWSRRGPTDWKGQPFSAMDMELRNDQNYTSNLTIQLGWQWTNPALWSLRLCAEYYNGRSPFGQFYLDRENWYAFSALYDW